LGEGEPNEDLTWVLFDGEHDVARHEPSMVDRNDDEQTGRHRASSEDD
jgi:hypothetical protein